MCVGSCLATKAFTGNLPATGSGSSYSSRSVKNGGQLPTNQLPYPRERGPMGGAPYNGPRLGDGPIFEVSVSHLDTRVPR